MDVSGRVESGTETEQLSRGPGVTKPLSKLLKKIDMNHRVHGDG